MGCTEMISLQGMQERAQSLRSMAASAQKAIGADVAATLGAAAERLENGGIDARMAALGAARTDGAGEAQVASQEYVNSVLSAHTSGGRSQGSAGSGQPVLPKANDPSINPVKIDYDQLNDLIASALGNQDGDQDSAQSNAGGQVFTSFA